MRRYAVAAAIVAVLALVVWNQYRVSGNERALAAVASEIAGRDVGVRCQGFFLELVDIGWKAGEVRYHTDGRLSEETWLSRDTCRSIARYPEERTKTSFACVHVARPCGRDAIKVAYALAVLAHEAWHLRGITNEAQAECYALQTAALVAERFGAPRDQAQMLALWNFKEPYPNLPSNYRSHGCVDGGALDLTPGDGVWP